MARLTGEQASQQREGRGREGGRENRGACCVDSVGTAVWRSACHPASNSA